MAEEEIDNKAYDAQALEHEKLSNDIRDANLIVKEFVQENKRIIVGGMAIDLLLREFGAQIYPDSLLSFPDIDIFTPDNITDVQELADILHKKGFPNVSAISAIHILTRKCRIDGRVVCDASYIPPVIFKKIPFLDLKNGYRVIHPLYQKMDQHMLLSKLYTDTPREACFNRLKKDITRYNLLNEYYPINPAKEKVRLFKVSIPAEFWPSMKEIDLPTILHGYAAYAALIQSAKIILGGEWEKIQKDEKIIIAEAEIEDGIFTFESITNEIHLLIDAASDAKEPKGAISYESLLDMIPEKWVLERTVKKQTITIELWRFSGLLISAGAVEISGQNIIIPSIQYVLMFLLTMHFFGPAENKNLNLLLYQSLLKLLEYLESHYSKDDNSPFFIPTSTIGRANLTPSQVVSLMKIRENLYHDEPELLCLPPNYWPATSNKVKNYDYDACLFFQKAGREIHKKHH